MSNNLTSNKLKRIPEPEDHVDWALAEWRRERPDLDTSAKAVTQRLGRSAYLFERALERAFADFGLSPQEFYVLGVLRRAGTPYRMSPSALARTLLLTSASVTHRVDRLEAAGLVARTPDPADRRSVLVGLTRAGRELADRAVEVLVALEHRTVAGLSANERKDLARLLRKLLVTLGDTPGTGRPQRR